MRFASPIGALLASALLQQGCAVQAPPAAVPAPPKPSADCAQGFDELAWVRLYLQEHLVARGARFDTDDMFQGVAEHCDVQVHGGQYRLSLDGEKQPRPYLIVWRRMNADWFVIAHHVDLAPRATHQPAGTSPR